MDLNLYMFLQGGAAVDSSINPGCNISLGLYLKCTCNDLFNMHV